MYEITSICIRSTTISLSMAEYYRNDVNTNQSIIENNKYLFENLKQIYVIDVLNNRQADLFRCIDMKARQAHLDYIVV